MRTEWSWRWALPLFFALHVQTLTPITAQVSAQQSGETFYEFGSVVEVGRSTVRLRVPDPGTGRPVDRTFSLGRGTEADLVHVGDTVEVIYTAGAENVLERLIALHGPVPRPGPSRPSVAPALPAAAVPATPVTEKASSSTVDSAPPIKTTGSKRRSRRDASRTAARSATIPAPSPVQPVPAVVPARQSVALGSAATAKVPAVSPVGLGGSALTVNPAVPRATAVAHQTPGALCDRRADWPAQPITLAVLDFRYPTEREEAHDVAQVGGGSGTALADQVYNLLGSDPDLALSRGDREKLFRMDFAGAARLGRQLGVDAVLLGTFVPVEPAHPDPDFPPPTEAYTLRAGVVETCTGELLYKLDSLTCGAGATGPTCPGSEVTTKQASDPDGNAAAFREPLQHLLGPLVEHQTASADAGTVTAVQGSTVTFRIAPGTRLQPGEQVGVHASRLAKIPSTNTLHVFRDELIGRVTIARINGREAQGIFAGEPAPLPGDGVDVLPQ